MFFFRFLVQQLILTWHRSAKKQTKMSINQQKHIPYYNSNDLSQIILVWLLAVAMKLLGTFCNKRESYASNVALEICLGQVSSQQRNPAPFNNASRMVPKLLVVNLSLYTDKVALSPYLTLAWKNVCPQLACVCQNCFVLREVKC